MRFLRIAFSAVLILGGLSVVPAPAVGQEAESEAQESQRYGIEEIVVTAERREKSVQDTPIAISAFSAAEIGRSDLDAIENIQFQVPGLVYAEVESYSQVTLRGVGLEVLATAGEPGVAFNIDGVYLPRSTTSNVILSDLERIEILRGPQGTLYGRNTAGGAINLWTKVPSGEYEGDISVLFGNENRFRTRAAISFPIGEQLSARVGFASDEHDGYRRNEFAGGGAQHGGACTIANCRVKREIDERDHDSFRGVLRWVPTDDAEVLWRYAYSRDHNGGPSFQYGTEIIPALAPSFFGGISGDRGSNFQNDFPSKIVRRTQSFSQTISLDLSLPWLGDTTLKSVTAYQKFYWRYHADNDGTDIAFLNALDTEETKTWSQELTLSSAGDGPLEWVGGLFYFSDRADSGRFDRPFENPETYVNPILPENLGFNLNQKIEAWAAFAQGSYHVTDRLRLTVGARFTREEKDFKNHIDFTLTDVQGGFFGIPGGTLLVSCPGVEHDNDWSKWTPKFGIDYSATDDILLFASISRGFKAGGANGFACGEQFDQEDLWAYEVGVKSQWFNNRLQVNLAGFYYDYEDFQALIFTEAASRLENASDADVWGAELEFVVVPFEGFQLKGGGSLQKAAFDDFPTVDQMCQPGVPENLNAGCSRARQLKGNDLPRAPRKSWFVNAEYERPIGDWGTGALRYEFSWTDKYYFTPFNNFYTQQTAFSLSNVRFIYGTSGGRLEDRLGDMELHLYINNWGNKDYLGSEIEVTLTGGTLAQWQNPRNYGVELRYRF